MTGTTVQTSILPPAQMLAWPLLAEIPKGFVLYGGTAIALQLGHRESVDFDFFTSGPVDPAALMQGLDLLREGEIVQAEPRTLEVLIAMPNTDQRVKIAFFEVPALTVVADPFIAAGNGIAIANLLDLGGTKAKTIQQRVEVKDSLDIAALIESGMAVEEMVGACVTIFGAHQISPFQTLLAMADLDNRHLVSLPKSARKVIEGGLAAAGPVASPPARYESISASAAAIGR